MTEQESKRELTTSFSIDKNTLDRLRRAAFEQGVKPSKLLYQITVEYLNKWETAQN